MINNQKNTKINRFILKLASEGGVFADKKTTYEIYFSHSPLTKEPNIRYDRDRRCYYFDNMETAIQAREHLKEHFEREIKAERMRGYVPLYDVMSEMIPWYDCDFDRKKLQDIVENGKGVEFAIIPESMKGVEDLIEELEKEDALNLGFQKELQGDTDADVPKGFDAIRLAEIGIGSLRLISENKAVPVSLEEAKQIASTNPDSIILVMDDPF